MAMLRALAAARRHDITVPLAQTTAPVLVLRGSHDRIATSAVTMPAGAHMVVMTHGPLVAAAIQTDLASHSVTRQCDSSDNAPKASRPLKRCRSLGNKGNIT